MPKMPKLQKVKVDPKDDPFDESSLDKMSIWAGLGFTALSAILTFLGSTGGYLQRILAEDPRGALWVFVLIGTGVVASLFAGAAKSDFHIPSVYVAGAVGLLAVITAAFVRDLDDSDGTADRLLFGLVIAGLVLAGVLLGRKSAMALPAGLLVVAVAATSMGLYGAVKISVSSRALPEEALNLEHRSPRPRIVMLSK